MSDIVERLRFNASAGVPDFTNSKLLDEAADRIETLIGLVGEFKFALKYSADRIEVLENALREIADDPTGVSVVQAEIAIAALVPEQKK